MSAAAVLPLPIEVNDTRDALGVLVDSVGQESDVAIGDRVSATRDYLDEYLSEATKSPELPNNPVLSVDEANSSLGALDRIDSEIQAIETTPRRLSGAALALGSTSLALLGASLASGDIAVDLEHPTEVAQLSLIGLKLLGLTILGGLGLKSRAGNQYIARRATAKLNN